MNRFLRRLFFGCAAIALVFALLTALDLHGLSLPWAGSKTFWTMLAGAVFFIWAGARFPFTTRFKLFMVLFALLAVEVLLQGLGWLGWMRGINTKEPLPWGRVYWAGEGLGNSIRNRYAWHFPEFALERSNRVALIGDSFVEAVEVRRAHTMGVVLRDHLHERDASTTAMSFGVHGTGPAQYFELLKYARRHFGIQDAILVIYLGNDVSDSSPRLQFNDPKQYIYYQLGPDGSVTLDATGEQARANFERGLEARHRSFWLTLPRLVASHSMCVQLPLSVWNTRERRRRIEQDPAHNVAMETELAHLGLKGAAFAIPPSPEAHEGLLTIEGILDRAAVFAREKQIKLHIVTVPFFPPEFYRQQGKAWTAQLGPYDFFGPDRELKNWAARRGLPFLSLGQSMQALGMTPQEIQPLYLFNGCGHFSEAGHQFAGNEIYRAFYPATK